MTPSAARPEDDVLQEMETTLAGVDVGDIKTAPGKVARQISDLLTLAYRCARELRQRAHVEKKKAEHGQPPGEPVDAGPFRAMLGRCVDACRDADTCLDQEIAFHDALPLIDLEHEVAAVSDSLSRTVTRRLVECARLFDLGNAPRARKLPREKKSWVLYARLRALEARRREAEFFPRHSFTAWSDDSKQLARLAEEPLPAVAHLVSLMALERQMRRRETAFQDLADWAATDLSGDIPQKPESKGQSDTQHGLIAEIRAGIAKRDRTQWSLESLWGWFGDASPLNTLLRYVGLAVSGFSLAYFGQEWTEVAKANSQQVLTAAVLLLFFALGYVHYWTFRAREKAKAPGVPSLSVAAVLLALAGWAVATERFAWPSLAAWQREWTCDGAMSGIACYSGYAVAKRGDAHAVLYRLGAVPADAKQHSYVLVKPQDILLQRDDIVLVAQPPCARSAKCADEPDKSKPDRPATPGGETPPITPPPAQDAKDTSTSLMLNLTTSPATASTAATDLAPVARGLGDLTRAVSQLGTQPVQATLSLPEGLLEAWSGTLLRLGAIHAEVAEGRKDERARAQAHVLDFCYDKLMRERGMRDKAKGFVKGSKSDDAELERCVQRWRRMGT